MPDHCDTHREPEPCDACYADDVHQVENARTLAEDLAEIEATDPDVAAAAAELGQVKWRIAEAIRITSPADRRTPSAHPGPSN